MKKSTVHVFCLYFLLAVLILSGCSHQPDTAAYSRNGNTADNNAVVAFTLNRDPIMRHKGKRVFFNQVIPLKEGKNTITLEAKDDAGNVATRELVVTRYIPKALQLDERLSMTVFPFEQKGC